MIRRQLVQILNFIAGHRIDLRVILLDVAHQFAGIVAGAADHFHAVQTSQGLHVTRLLTCLGHGFANYLILGFFTKGNTI